MQCLTYLTVIYRKRRQVEETRHYVSRSLPVATAAKMVEYIAAAKANLAWVAWREKDLSRAQENGRAALELWQQPLPVYPFQWTALWPLIGVALAQAQVSEAVDYARALLEPAQQRFPDALTAVVEEAIKAWEGGESETTRTHLNQATDLAQELGYL
jgi:tetratricopeptide (TPR) repeat protein